MGVGMGLEWEVLFVCLSRPLSPWASGQNPDTEGLAVEKRKEEKERKQAGVLNNF